MSFLLILFTYLEPDSRIKDFEENGMNILIILFEGAANLIFMLDIIMLTYHLQFDFTRNKVKNSIIIQNI